MVILSTAAFTVRSAYHRRKYKSLGQLFFGRYMIIPTNNVADWRYIRQSNQTQINKDANRENTTRTDHNYKVGDKVMTTNRSVYKYKKLFRGLYEIFQTRTRRINIRIINPYNDTDIE